MVTAWVWVPMVTPVVPDIFFVFCFVWFSQWFCYGLNWVLFCFFSFGFLIDRHTGLLGWAGPGSGAGCLGWAPGLAGWLWVLILRKPT
jgi:hypothetical protein